MFARRVSVHLKPNSSDAFIQKMENQVLPLLRKQTGFKDQITFLSQDGSKAFGISLWDKKESAETYIHETYPTVEKILASVVEGSPQVGSYNVATSTFYTPAAGA